MRIFLILVALLLPVLAHAQPKPPPPQILLNQSSDWRLQQRFNGGINIGNGTGSAVANILGSSGTSRSLNYFSGNFARWGLVVEPAAETGNNTGSDFLLGAYTDTGLFSGTAFDAQRASGPFGNGGPWFAAFSPMVQSSTRASVPGGVSGSEINFLAGADVQPITQLAANPLTVIGGSPTVTVSWPGCCGLLAPLYIGNGEAWVNLTGAAPVGGITPSGWLKVASNVDVNTFTVTWSSSAISSATGGGTAINIQPSFVTQGTKSFMTFTSGAAGFPVGHTDYFVANPSFYQTSSFRPVQYQREFSQVYTPTDSSQTKAFGTVSHEMDVINRASDEGYSPNLYSSPRPTIGLWMGPESSVASFIPGGGTAKNWNTMISCFSSQGIVGIYNCNSIQPNALVGASRDPTGHGGVGYDFFGSFLALPINPFTTAVGTSVVTISIVSGEMPTQVNGNSVFIPGAYTINGVTFGGGNYTITNVTSSTFTITGSGTASANGSGGGTNQWASFATLVPYAPVQFMGEWKHGVSTTNFKADDGLIINTQPGNGMGWNDGAGTASVTGTEVSPGNISVDLAPAGAAPINAKGVLNLKGYTVAALPSCVTSLKGGMTYVTDATAPAYNGTLTGGGSVVIPAFCNGSLWTAH